MKTSIKKNVLVKNPHADEQWQPTKRSRAERFRRFIKSDHAKGYLFILPWIIGFVLFSAGPFAVAIYNSFTTVTLFKTGQWVGLDNYQRLFTSDATFRTTVTNMIVYISFALPITIGLGLGLAVMLKRVFPGNYFFRTIFYVPSLLVGAASGTMFKQIFSSGEVGLANQVLGVFGVAPVNWLNNPQQPYLATVALIFVNCWFAGGAMLIFLAGLKAISPDYYEAARIDGADNLRAFLYITLPLLAPTIVFNVIITLIGQIQLFDIPMVFAGNGGYNSLTPPLGYRDNLATFLSYIYDKGFRSNQIGYASALAVIVFVITLTLSMVILWWARRNTYFGDQENG